MEHQEGKRTNDLHTELSMIKKDLSQLRTDFADLTASAIDHGKAEYNLKKETLIKDGKEACQYVEKTMAENPGKTLLCAFGLGFLLSSLVSKKCSHTKKD